MLKSIERTMLTSAMGSAWDLIRIGERIVAFSESWDLTETSDLRAGFIERLIYKTGLIVTRVGERIETGVNRFAMHLGYNDSEVSGMVAWPAQAR